MVPWNFDFLWKNYGTMEKLWYYGKKLLDYTDNYGNLIYKHKNLENYKKLRNSDLYWEKNYGNIPKQL